MAKKSKTINPLCKMCKNNCKDLYKYGEQHVKVGCYFIKNNQDGDGEYE